MGDGEQSIVVMPLDEDDEVDDIFMPANNFTLDSSSEGEPDAPPKVEVAPPNPEDDQDRHEDRSIKTKGPNEVLV